MFKKKFHPDWKCPMCNNYCFGSRSECNECGCFRSKANKSSNQVKKKGDWNCECGELNFASRTGCRKCFKNKPFNGDYSNNKDNKKPGDWDCECGELNFSSRKNCRKCSKSRVIISSEVKPGDWICANCNINNFGNRTACFKCGKNKPIEEKKCIICMEHDIDTVIKLCGHRGYCFICANKMFQCPICRINYNPDNDILKCYEVI